MNFGAAKAATASIGAVPTISACSGSLKLFFRKIRQADNSVIPQNPYKFTAPMRLWY
jgi:hypothetical protein